MFTPLEIKPETAEMLVAQARSRGVSVDDYLRTLLPFANGNFDEQPLYQSAIPEEWVRAFRSGPQAIPRCRLSPTTVARASIRGVVNERLARYQYPHSFCSTSPPHPEDRTRRSDHTEDS